MSPVPIIIGIHGNSAAHPAVSLPALSLACPDCIEWVELSKCRIRQSLRVLFFIVVITFCGFGWTQVHTRKIAGPTHKLVWSKAA